VAGCKCTSSLHLSTCHTGGCKCTGREGPEEGGERLEGPGGGAVDHVGLVLGSEGQGIMPELAWACRPVAIPMVGGWESLNVSQAGAILMFMLSPSLPAVQTQLARLGVATLLKSSP
jgi:tRNA C32,U32 (ribose-2'-O)-methylase TrmJ